MTAEPSLPVLDGHDDGRGAVPHDDGAALYTVENGEAVGLSSMGGLMRGLALTLAQARAARREVTRLARDCARIARAAIFEGIHFRAQQGLTVGKGFDRLGDMVPPLIERGHAALSGTT